MIYIIYNCGNAEQERVSKIYYYLKDYVDELNKYIKEILK
jgi:hypothetical protein